MNINDLTIGQARELAALFSTSTQSANDAHWNIGANYFIRTVTMNHTGRLVAVTDKELVLEDAAWIADSGRFTQALVNGTYNEVEMFPKGRVIVGRGALVDACEIMSIPKSQK